MLNYFEKNKTNIDIYLHFDGSVCVCHLSFNCFGYSTVSHQAIDLILFDIQPEEIVEIGP